MDKKAKKEIINNEERKKCFVIMPISGVEGYDFNYFKNVYTDLIKDACKDLDLEIFRADEEKEPNLIQEDIVRKLIESDLVICDISFHNPNVLFELGIRQAFDKPVILIKDKETKSIFDISAIRYIEYDRAMKYRDVNDFHTSLRETVEKVLNNGMKGTNSLISLVKLNPANIDVDMKNNIEPSNSLIYGILDNLSKDIKNIKENIGFDKRRKMDEKFEKMTLKLAEENFVEKFEEKIDFFINSINHALVKGNVNDDDLDTELQILLRQLSDLYGECGNLKCTEERKRKYFERLYDLQIKLEKIKGEIKRKD